MNTYFNCEIYYRWYQLCIRVNHIESLDDIFKFLKNNSRMKYLKPLYSEFRISWPEMMIKIRELFEQQKQYTHPITTKQIEIRI
jgi:hypothetical protein